MDKYSLIINSKLETSIPIAVIKNKGNDIIELQKVNKNQNVNSQIMNKNDVYPIFYKEKDQNIRIYIAGESGAGKSYITSKILEIYIKMYPEQRIILFSELYDDKMYDENNKLKRKIIRYNVEEENMESLRNLTEEQLRNSICIFDDFRSVKRGLINLINSIKDRTLRRGRHYNIDCIVINDKACDGQQTKAELKHCQYVIFFPKFSNSMEMERLLVKYLSLEKGLIPLLNKLDSRWVMIKRIFPKYLVYQHGTHLI